jgi:hypothetical protein
MFFDTIIGNSNLLNISFNWEYLSKIYTIKIARIAQHLHSH